MNKKELIKQLKTIKENDYEIKKEDATEYLKDMLIHIGDPDPLLRDKLICSCLSTWIEVKRYFDNETLRSLTHQLMTKQFIFNGIGQKNDDSVYTRSFSMLLINPILEVHLINPIFKKEDIILIKESLIKYFELEQDTRAYDSEKGWAHSVSHYADSLYILLNCPELKEEDCFEILDMLQKKYLSHSDILTTDEDERMGVCIAYSIIGEQLVSEDKICEWINGFKKIKDIQDWQERFNIKTNVMHLMRSVYFMILHEKNNGPIMKTIESLDKCLSPYHQ